MGFRLLIRRLRYHVSSLLPCTTRSSTTIGVPSQLEASLEATPCEHRHASLEATPCEHRHDRAAINTLPDDVLVETFHFYLNCWPIRTNKWHTLAHVCQRWRHVVFTSPRRLNLRLEYTGKRPMSEMLDVWPVWPVLPVVMIYDALEESDSWENLVVALESEHHHHICQIDMWRIPPSEWERFAAAMQKPFPELTSLRFRAPVEDDTPTSLPDSFLGGSAPLLRELCLTYCPFPGIFKLLLSSNQLVHLGLLNIPNSGYISPQDLVTALSAMSRLESLALEFKSPLYPASRPRPPLTRSVLPALTRLAFEGVHEYSEDLLAQIEAPLLTELSGIFFMDTDFVLPQLHRLISQIESFNSCDRATVRISGHAIQFTISRGRYQPRDLSLKIKCRELDQQLASLAQVCNPTFPFFSTLVQLAIMGHDTPRSHWTHDTETTRWLELLAPFIAVKELRLTYEVGPHVCQALEELAGERITEVFPALQDIFSTGLEPLGSVPKYIEGFVAARKLSGHPVAVHRWEYEIGRYHELYMHALHVISI